MPRTHLKPSNSNNRAILRHFVATGFIVEGGKTLLVFHKKLQMWLPPGGHIDPNETPDDAVIREVREETGLEVEIASPKRSPNPADGKVTFLHRPHHVQLEDIPDPKGFHQHIDLIYFCRPIGGNTRLETREHEQMRWFSAEDLQSPEIVEEVRDTALLALEELS